LAGWLVWLLLPFFWRFGEATKLVLIFPKEHKGHDFWEDNIFKVGWAMPTLPSAFFWRFGGTTKLVLIVLKKYKGHDFWEDNIFKVGWAMPTLPSAFFLEVWGNDEACLDCFEEIQRSCILAKIRWAMPTLQFFKIKFTQVDSILFPRMVFGE